MEEKERERERERRDPIDTLKAWHVRCCCGSCYVTGTDVNRNLVVRLIVPSCDMVWSLQLT
jgi:hypothetical protein